MVGGVCDCSVAMRILPAVCNYRNDLFTYLCECPLQFLSYVVCARVCVHIYICAGGGGGVNVNESGVHVCFMHLLPVIWACSNSNTAVVV